MRAILLSAERKAEVEQAWHGSMTRAQVASWFGLSEKAVRTIWKRARKAGALPMEMTRPHFAALQAVSDPDAPETDEEISLEADQAHAANVACSDGLLLALSKRHAGDKAPTLRPTDYALRCELKGEAIPTPADIMALCRIHDLNSSN